MIFDIARVVWRYRSEIILAVQVVAALRKTAQEVTREYIRRRVKEKLARQLALVSLQIALFLAAWYWNRVAPGPEARGFASLVLWAVTLYNVLDWVLFTIPELLEVRRTLRSKTGYTVRYLLRISLVTELMELNILFLAFCVFLASSSRALLGVQFSYFP